MISLLCSAVMLGSFSPVAKQETDFSRFKPYSPVAGDGDYLIEPPFTNAPELTPRASVPKGTVYHFTMDSTHSRIYPGIDKNVPLRSSRITAT
jgi:hypothetical protein